MSREDKKRAKRERILEIALRLFGEKGYSNTTVAEITQTAGVAKGTFFTYFQNKEEVLLFVGEAQVAWIREQIASLIGLPGLLAPSLTELMVAMPERFQATPALVLAMFEVTTSSGTHLSSQYHYGTMLREALIPLFEQGQARGEFVTHIPAKQMASLWVQSYFGALLTWCIGGGHDDLRGRLFLTYDTLLHGIVRH